MSQEKKTNQKYERRRKSCPQKVQVECSYFFDCMEKVPVEKSWSWDTERINNLEERCRCHTEKQCFAW